MKNDVYGDDFDNIDGPPEPYDVHCARCGKLGTSETFYVEEGDEWECPPCWERCEAQERAAAMKSVLQEKS